MSDAMLNGESSVFGGGHALQDKGQTRYLLDGVERIPGEPGAIFVTCAAPARRQPAVHHLTLAVAVVRGVDGKA